MRSPGLFAAIAGMVVMSRRQLGQGRLRLVLPAPRGADRACSAASNPYGGYGRVIGVVLAVLSMQFLSSGLNMLGVSNFARELIWGALLLLVMVVNAGDLAAPPRPVRRGEPARNPRRNGDTMKKILNDPADYVDEMLDGLVAAHPEYLPPARRQPPGHRARGAGPRRQGRRSSPAAAPGTCRSSPATSARACSTPAPSATSSPRPPPSRWPMRSAPPTRAPACSGSTATTAAT